MADTPETTTPPEPVPTPDSPALYEWRQDIHPDVKDDKLWVSVPDVKSLTKGYADAVKYNLGAVKIPPPDAPTEAWSAFYEKLGRPASPEAYNLSEDGAKDPVLAPMRNVAHSAGLTPSQWDMLRDGYNRGQDERYSTQREDQRKAEETLKAEWGGAYDRNVGLIKRAIRQMGGDEALAAIVDRGLGNDVGFLKMMNKVSKALLDEGITTGEVEGQLSLDAAKSELDTLTASKAYLEGHHPEHDKYVQRAKQLFELIFN